LNLSIESLKNYFGEKLAMYFLFLISYTKSIKYMLLLSIIGHLLFIEFVTTDYMSIFTLIILSFSICIWNSLFLSHWKK